MPPEDHHRRSIYTFVKRSVPNPSMAVFDLPERTVSEVKRDVSNTPLQALALWNGPQYVEAYRVMASDVMGDIEDTDARLQRLFRLTVRRGPTADELSVLQGFYSRELGRFRSAPADAEALIAIGVTPLEPNRDAPELAALTNVTAAMMNTPDAYSIR